MLLGILLVLWLLAECAAKSSGYGGMVKLVTFDANRVEFGKGGKK